jgi:hypothetical protein
VFETKAGKRAAGFKQNTGNLSCAIRQQYLTLAEQDYSICF